MEYNKIEIMNSGFKNQFKQLVGKSGPFFETLFPWPPVKLHGKPLGSIDSFIWCDQTQGLLPNSQPSQITARAEEPNTLTYRFTTAHWPRSYKFIKNLAFMFPIRRIVLTHYNKNDHVCIERKRPDGGHILNCCHHGCLNYVLPRVYDLDWRDEPHPIYEVHQTMNTVIKGSPIKNNFTEEEYGRIYHHLIFEKTLFATFENQVIRNARLIFEEQVHQVGNPYLCETVLFDTYAVDPTIQPQTELGRYARYIESRYYRSKYNGRNIGPQRVRR